MIVVVDTNVLVRTLSPGDPHHQVAVEALASLRMSRHVAAVVPQVLYELWAVATRPAINNGLGFNIQQAADDQQRILASFDLLEEDHAVFDSWKELIALHEVTGKQSHDCHIVAAMVRHGVTHLLTFNDQDFARFNEIAIIAPADAASFPPVA